jgi:dCMP deaminase
VEGYDEKSSGLQFLDTSRIVEILVNVYEQIAEKVGPYTKAATDVQDLNSLTPHATPAYDKWDLRFLEVARLVSTWSKDPSTQTGSVIVRDRKILSVGYNGFPKTMNDSAELYANREEKYSRIVHCEINALIQAEVSVKGATLYTWPFCSCDRCAVQMIQAGITRFVFPETAPDKVERWGKAFDRSKTYFKECGVAFTEVPWNEFK